MLINRLLMSISRHFKAQACTLSLPIVTVIFKITATDGNCQALNRAAIVICIRFDNLQEEESNI